MITASGLNAKHMNWNNLYTQVQELFKYINKIINKYLNQHTQNSEDYLNILNIDININYYTISTNYYYLPS